MKSMIKEGVDHPSLVVVVSAVFLSNTKANGCLINYIYSSMTSNFLFVSAKPFNVATALWLATAAFSSAAAALRVACLTSSWSLSVSSNFSCVEWIVRIEVKGWVKDEAPWWMLAAKSPVASTPPLLVPPAISFEQSIFVVVVDLVEPSDFISCTCWRYVSYSIIIFENCIEKLK